VVEQDKVGEQRVELVLGADGRDHVVSSECWDRWTNASAALAAPPSAEDCAAPGGAAP
jgi:hypothetical protein